jgi:CubicO group peptidase (beta-lactamase class C family)
MAFAAVLVLCATSAATASSSSGASSDGLPRVKPEAVGFSSERLQTLTKRMHESVDAGQYSGVVTLVSRHGKVFYTDVYGMKDIGRKEPMAFDTIFRIHSMTKPITGVAMMMLYEEGKWIPDDPISRYLPEFADVKVLKGLDADGKPVLEAPVHAPTVGELMSHTAGFLYGLSGNSPADKLYGEANIFGAATSQEFVQRLAKLPLAYQPGTKWVYSASVDVQGAIVEKLSGKTLPEFMRERIFDPLGMKDTAFNVPEEKLARLATVYVGDAAGVLQPQARAANITRVPTFASGGGGLYSTVGDYMRFAQMLANGGVLNGKRLLAPRTIELMSTNHLPKELMTGEFGIGMQRMRPGFGFGYGVAVFENPELANSVIGKGSYLWDGAAGTWFWVDPAHEIVYVGMIQRRFPGGPPVPFLQQLARPLLYQALVEPAR